MKTMKLWRNILVMCAAMVSLASCSSDDDDKFDASRLEGKWRKAICLHCCSLEVFEHQNTKNCT